MNKPTPFSDFVHTSFREAKKLEHESRWEFSDAVRRTIVADWLTENYDPVEMTYTPGAEEALALSDENGDIAAMVAMAVRQPDRSPEFHAHIVGRAVELQVRALWSTVEEAFYEGIDTLRIEDFRDWDRARDQRRDDELESQWMDRQEARAINEGKL